MDNDRIVVVLNIPRINKSFDIDIPIDITINELIIGLNEALYMGMNSEQIAQSYIKCENPIALLKGNKTIEECGLWNGSVINLY